MTRGGPARRCERTACAGARPTRRRRRSADFSADNVEACEQRGIDAYLAVGRERTVPNASAPEPVEPATRAQHAKQRMRDKLHTVSGKEIYARRKTIAEPPFGQIKEARGFRRFSLRGLAKVRSEWAFVCLTHNLLELFRATWSATSTGYTTCPATAT